MNPVFRQCWRLRIHAFTQFALLDSRRQVAAHAHGLVVLCAPTNSLRIIQVVGYRNMFCTQVNGAVASGTDDFLGHAPVRFVGRKIVAACGNGDADDGGGKQRDNEQS